MKKYVGMFAVLFVLLCIGSLWRPTASRSAILPSRVIRIVDSLGNVVSGTASAVTAAYNETVQVVDSNGNVIDSFGGATPAVGVVGNPTIYTGVQSLGPAAAVFHAGSSTLASIFYGASYCRTSACTVYADSNQTYTNAGPLVIGAVYPQTLRLMPGAVINNTDTTANKLDDGIIVGPYGRLICDTQGPSTHPTRITEPSTAVLNSLVTTHGGAIENAWQTNTPYSAGIIYDSTANVTAMVVGAGTSGAGPAAPAFSTTVGNLTTDNTVTWQTVAVGHWGTTVGREVIQGCSFLGTNSSNTNYIVRISGAQGGNWHLSDVSSGGLPTSSTGYEFDDGQTNSVCTAASTPFACCSGNNAGTCQSGSTAIAMGEIDNINLGPGTPSGNGPSYGIRVTHQQASGTSGQLTFKNGNIGDICGSNNVALVSVDGNNMVGVTFEGIQFEMGSGGCTEGGTDGIIVNGARQVDFNNDNYHKNGATALTNCFHLEGSNLDRISITGRLTGTAPCTNYITNDVSGNTIATGAVGQGTKYEYIHSTSSQWIVDGPASVFTTLTATLGLGSIPATLTTFGTCNAAHEGLVATQTNSTGACSVGATATSAGTTHCQIYCNGTNWLQTGL